MRKGSCLIALAILAGFMISTGCTAPPASQSSYERSPAIVSSVTTGVSTSPPAVLSLTVDSLNPGSVLPDTYTCKGAGTSPEVTWTGLPAATKSLVLVLDDPDAPSGIFTHWLVYNINPASDRISSAQPSGKVLENGAQQGETSAGSRGYYPPCPPVGTTHRYIFRLFALDAEIVNPSANRDSINSAMEGHIIGKAVFTTPFTR